MAEIEFWHHHGGVSVPNLDEAIDWWRDVLGFQCDTRFAIPTVPCKAAMLSNGNLNIELFEAPGGKPPPYDRSYPDRDILTYGNKHVSFAVADVPAMAEELKRRGADIVWVKQFDDGRSNIFLRDNAGNLIEFIQEAKPPAAISSLTVTA